VLIQASRNPHAKAAAAVVLTEVTTYGVAGLYNRFMDNLAYKIAVTIHTLEKEEQKQGEK
jgi:hypothetical protein